jgi:glutamine synthetase
VLFRSRFQSTSFAPTNATWGEDNRTTAIRLVHDAETGSRLENRIGSADSNPYLAIAANLIAGLEGIEQSLESTPETRGNGYEVDSATKLPRSLREAISLASKSKIAKKYFGESFVKDYLALSQREVDLFDQTVTDWERERYLNLL